MSSGRFLPWIPVLIPPYLPEPLTREPPEPSHPNLPRSLKDYLFICKSRQGWDQQEHLETQVQHIMSAFDQPDAEFNHRIRYPLHEVVRVQLL